LTPDARTLAADLYAEHAAAIASRLASASPATDPQTISDAVVRAVVWVAEHVERHDPRRGSMAAFLTGVARRALTRLLRGDSRRRKREQKKAVDPVTAVAPAGQSFLDELIDRETVRRVREELELSPEEGRLLDLWLLGEKDLAKRAAALGLADRPLPEQEQAVGRALARLRQRIHRVALRFRQEDQPE
jgi:DNA-directed RNA polymerase specialized sigma24 family protein